MLQGENVPGSVLILQKVIQELAEDGEEASSKRIDAVPGAEMAVSFSGHAKHCAFDTVGYWTGSGEKAKPDAPIRIV